MIGKPEWFTYRIFGWGIAPRKWQGFAYIAAIISILIAVMELTPMQYKMWAFGAVLIVMIADTLHIMTQLSKTHDERENLHQLIIERNCSFAAIAALIGVALYQTYERVGTLVSQNQIPFDISIAIVLGAMLLTKIVSTVYVKTKM